jgi:hypothetical protein
MANLAWMSLRSLASGASGNIAPSQRCTSGGLARGLVISERAVTHLLHRYEELVSLHITDREWIAARLQEQGQVILALDGLQPDVGHEVLWMVRDCFSEEILLARPLLSSTQGDITALLKARQAASGTPQDPDQRHHFQWRRDDQERGGLCLPRCCPSTLSVSLP